MDKETVAILVEHQKKLAEQQGAILRLLGELIDALKTHNACLKKLARK